MSRISTLSKTNRLSRRKEMPRLELAAPLDDAQWCRLWGKPKQPQPLRSYQTVFRLQPRSIKSHGTENRGTNSGKNPVRCKPPRVFCYRLEKDIFFMTSIRLGECFDEIHYVLYGSPKLSFEKGNSSSPKVTIDSCSSEDDEEIERVEFEKGVDEVDRMFIEAAEANSKNSNQGKAGIDQRSCDDHMTSQAKGLTNTTGGQAEETKIHIFKKAAAFIGNPIAKEKCKLRPNETLFGKYLQKQKAIRNRRIYELDSQQRAVIREDLFGSDTVTNE